MQFVMRRMTVWERFKLLVSRRLREEHERKQKAIYRELLKKPDAVVRWEE
jgi:hypothetical protein